MMASFSQLYSTKSLNINPYLYIPISIPTHSSLPEPCLISCHFLNIQLQLSCLCTCPFCQNISFPSHPRKKKKIPCYGSTPSKRVTSSLKLYLTLPRSVKFFFPHPCIPIVSFLSNYCFC